MPILEGLTITRETSGNAMFEKMYSRVIDAIREGETIARPMKAASVPNFHPVALFFWIALLGGPPLGILIIKVEFWQIAAIGSAALGTIGAMAYLLRMKGRVVEDLVINMVDVGEETGELDTMLYKVADYYEEEVQNLTDGMMKLIEPLMIIVLGGIVGFIVIALFMPLALITNLS